jgi:hypothetical protein
MLLADVPSPDDDDSEKAEIAIHNIMKRHEPQLLEIAEELDLNLYEDNTLRRVVSYCYRQNIFFWHIQGLTDDKNLLEEDLSDCIKQMRQLNKRDITDLIKTTLLANDIGLEYRKEWLSL